MFINILKFQHQANMTSAKHMITRENRELLEENDRLVGKIEKLMQIFGTNLDQEMLKFTISSEPQESKVDPSSEPKSPTSGRALTSARLFLLSRRAKNKPGQPVVEEPHAFSADHDIPSPLTQSTFSAPPQQAETNEKLKQDLERLDEEIDKLKPAASSNKKGGLKK